MARSVEASRTWKWPSFDRQQEIRSSVLQPQGIEICNNYMSSGRNSVWLTSWSQPCERLWAKDLDRLLTHGNREIKSICYFKPLNVWEFFSQQQKTNIGTNVKIVTESNLTQWLIHSLIHSFNKYLLNVYKYHAPC